LSDDKRKTLRDLLDELDRSFEEMEREIEEAVRHGFESGRKVFSRPFVAGISMGMGPEGKPTIQLFGNDPLSTEGFRSPIHEQVIDDNAKTLRVIVELPGVEKSIIEIAASEDRVSIKAEKDARKYRSEFPLKREVDPESAKAEYKNGILDLFFLIKDKTNKGYRRVSVV